MTGKKIPGLWEEAGADRKVCALMVGEHGQEERLPHIDPAVDLIAASELNYTACRREIQCFHDKYPLFEKQQKISESDLKGLAAETLMMLFVSQEIDPLNFSELGNLLNQALRMQDDGSAPYLLYAGQRSLQALEVPIRTQIRLHNIMEIASGGIKRVV